MFISNALIVAFAGLTLAAPQASESTPDPMMPPRTTTLSTTYPSETWSSQRPTTTRGTTFPDEPCWPPTPRTGTTWASGMCSPLPGTRTTSEAELTPPPYTPTSTYDPCGTRTVTLNGSTLVIVATCTTSRTTTPTLTTTRCNPCQGPCPVTRNGSTYQILATCTSTRTTTNTSFIGNPPGVFEKWRQCGGIGYTGAVVCVAGTTCTVLNPWYS